MNRRKTDDEDPNDRSDVDRWQVDEIRTGLRNLDEGRSVPHEKVATWLRSWGRKHERKTPRPRA
jgi:predicted transcriptional regulator